MGIDDAINELLILEQRLYQCKLIDRDSAATLNAAQQKLASRKRQGVAGPWQYEIGTEAPLIFRPTTELKYRIMPDVFGQFSEPVDGVPQADHSITVRLWVLQKTCWFDQAMDAPELEQTIDTGLRRRVMLRFRLDCAHPKLDEPWFHMQFGGFQTGQEYFRLPENFSVPRFSYYPMNLFLACEFIIRHFFPSEYIAISSEPTWQRALRIAQRGYLQRYLRKIDSFDRNYESSFLDHCWSR